VTNDLKDRLENAIEDMSSDLEPKRTRWLLPDGQHALVASPTGHLLAVHELNFLLLRQTMRDSLNAVAERDAQIARLTAAPAEPTDKRFVPWDGKAWGIFHLEGNDGPIAMFTGVTGKADAERELERRQGLDPEDDDFLNEMDIGILFCNVKLHFWNSYDDCPDEAAKVPS
jgi:hypothetical protein